VKVGDGYGADCGGSRQASAGNWSPIVSAKGSETEEGKEQGRGLAGLSGDRKKAGSLKENFMLHTYVPSKVHMVQWCDARAITCVERGSS